jgi:hypothetical protein
MFPLECIVKSELFTGKLKTGAFPLLKLLNQQLESIKAPFVIFMQGCVLVPSQFPH